MEFEKLQKTTYRGPEGHVTIIVQVIRTFLLDLKGQKKNFSKNSLAHRWEGKLAFFVLKRSMEEFKQHKIKLQKVFWQSLCKLHDHFCNT